MISSESLRASLSERPTVLIYADPLLMPSATFIRAQGEALRGFSPCYVGARLVKNGGLNLPERRVIVINKSGGKIGKLKEVPFKVFGYAPLFFRRVKRFRPVLLHAHFGPAALTALPLARWLKIPLITSFHGFDATVTDEAAACSNYTFRVYARRRDVLKRESRLFIAVSEFIKQKLQEHGFPEGRIVVHYIGVDTNFFRPDPAVKREPLVLFTARLAEKKGCEYLIRAMALVQSTMPEVELLIIGDGPLRASLEQQAREQLRQYRFLGVQPRDVIKHWMNRSRVFSVPSVRAESGDSEGFGMVFAEAQAMGLPVVSFASGGIPEAVSHGDTGYLAAERDWQGLAHYLMLLLRDHAVWRRMSKSGRDRVCSLFNLETQTRRLEDLYFEVLRRYLPPKAS